MQQTNAGEKNVHEGCEMVKGGGWTAACSLCVHLLTAAIRSWVDGQAADLSVLVVQSEHPEVSLVSIPIWDAAPTVTRDCVLQPTGKRYFDTS